MAHPFAALRVVARPQCAKNCTAPRDAIHVNVATVEKPLHVLVRRVKLFHVADEELPVVAAHVPAARHHAHSTLVFCHLAQTRQLAAVGDALHP